MNDVGNFRKHLFLYDVSVVQIHIVTSMLVIDLHYYEP